VIAERCRILAVVGLHGNTFKPHTGTKTSVLFVQKWNDDPKVGALCPRVEDYNIFFATMRKSGKDNSGDKIYVKKPDGSGEFLLDEHGHLMVDHDLFNHDGLTQDGIAEAFIEFAKKEKLSFFKPSPSVEPFDQTKYDRLMDGLEAVEARLSDLERTKRIDSEFFKKEHIEITSTLKQKALKSLTEIARVSDGNHMTISENFTDSGIPYYRGQDIHQFFVEQSSPTFINEDTYNLPQMKRCHLKKGDVLLSIVGSIGGVAFVGTDNLATCNCKLAILRPKSITPEYLAIYLKSKFGQGQINRFTRGAVQMGLILEDMDQFFIPDVKSDFEKLVSSTVESVKSCLRVSELEYKKAEELLLSELGLNDWQPISDTIAVKRFSDSWGGCDRGDAEHYQPKFDQLIQKLESKVKLQPLGNLLTVNQRGKQPNYLEEDEDTEGLPVVNSKHVREGSVILTDNRFATIPENDNALFIQKGDVLINGTGVGTIGRCAPYLYDQDALPDNHVTILRTEVLDPVYLSIYLNSITGQFQVEQYFKGSSGQIELYPNDIANFLIWEAPKSIQQKIKQKVEDSHHKREQSKQLLEIAKTGVERAIEDRLDESATYNIGS